jgi:hypothetical protein
MLQRLLHWLPPCPCVQIAWLKGELCVALEAERAASLRADELEAALVQVADKRHLDETKRTLQQQVSNTCPQQGTPWGGGAQGIRTGCNHTCSEAGPPARRSCCGCHESGYHESGCHEGWSRPSVLWHQLVAPACLVLRGPVCGTPLPG